LEKVALFEIGTTNIRLTLSQVMNSELFFVYKEFSEPVHINEHIENDGLIKSTKIKECISLLQMYKKICESEGITRFICVVSESLSEAKNYSSFLDESANACGLQFKNLTNEEEVNAVYTSVVNTVDVPKGVIVNISSHSTRIINYNRRVILDSATIALGSVSLFGATTDATSAIELFTKELNKRAGFLRNIDPESVMVGVSDTFVSFGRIARKMSKYPVDIDHNYVTDGDQFTKVFEFIKTLDPEKKQKLRGISSNSAQTILAGMCIIEAILNFSKMKNIVVSCAYRNLGLMFNLAVPYTQERPVSDVLGYSLEATSAIAGLVKKECEQMYSTALTLFKQLKVLHKLPRSYAKVLRIASYLYSIGKKSNPLAFERVNYSMILNANITGASHKDIVLAAFSASCKKWEDFNLAEWLRYKDITTQEDLDAVRKLSIIIAMAESLNVRNCDAVKDISCDILGDSVILKLIADENTKTSKIDVKALSMEIFYAKKYCAEFLKAFKKNLEIL
jgi:exopolyphosphatase/guanosine-5'-triphosphate,3'-diphosphate pyrophosphatase